MPTFTAIIRLVPNDEKAAIPDIFRLRDIDGMGLTRGRLRGLVSRGEAEKVARGLYRRPSEITVARHRRDRLRARA